MYPPPLALPMVAALTPEDVKVIIVDEKVEPIDFEENVDLVGISVMTPFAPRAYEIADIYRKRGIKTVLGGIHPTALPEEAIEHADAVVIGEAENVWGNLIEDFKKNRLKRFYHSDQLISMKGLPLPRINLLNKDAYSTINCVQTTRGCPHNCEFCSVTAFFGRRYRQRPIKEVITEIKRLKKGYIVFVDDNIMGDKKYARELFKALRLLNIEWNSYCTLSLAKDDELLKLAQESGCDAMYIGFESLSQENVDSIGKSFNRVEEYEEAVKRIQDHGIEIMASFIFGLDHDDETVFEKTINFIKKNKIKKPVFSILTPYPGTKLYQRLEQENRIIDRDWSKYDFGHVVIKPKLMSPETLQRGYNRVSRFSKFLPIREALLPKQHLPSYFRY